MSRKTGKTENCTKADARTRLAQAELYAQVANMVLGEDDGASLSVAAGNAVLAAIAASDAICCHANGTRWRGQNHIDAVKHLESVTGDEKLAGLLAEVLDDKDAAHYGLGNVRLSKAKTAVRKAAQLVGAAKTRIRG